jgi:cell division protein FtsB
MSARSAASAVAPTVPPTARPSRTRPVRGRSATRPAPTRTSARTRTAPAGTLPRARVQVAAPSRARARRAPFVVLIVTLLGGGLIALLLLNMVLAQDAFTVTQLQAQVSQLQDQQEALAQQVDRLGSPERLAQRAHALGMVVSPNPVFLRSTDGRVVGVPTPGGWSTVPRAPQPVEPDPLTADNLPDLPAPSATRVHR